MYVKVTAHCFVIILHTEFKVFPPDFYRVQSYFVYTCHEVFLLLHGEKDKAPFISGTRDDLLHCSFGGLLHYFCYYNQKNAYLLCCHYYLKDDGVELFC